MLDLERRQSGHRAPVALSRLRAMTSYSEVKVSCGLVPRNALVSIKWNEKRQIWMYVTRGWTKQEKRKDGSWRVPGRRADCRSLRSPRAGRFPFSIIFQLRRSENRKNAANPAFFDLDGKLPKLRTWVRFPSPAP